MKEKDLDESITKVNSNAGTQSYATAYGLVAVAKAIVIAAKIIANGMSWANNVVPPHPEITKR